MSGRLAWGVALLLVVATLGGIAGVYTVVQRFLYLGEDLQLESAHNTVWHLIQADKEALRLQSAVVGLLREPHLHTEAAEGLDSELARRVRALEVHLEVLRRGGSGGPDDHEAISGGTLNDFLALLKQTEAELEERPVSVGQLRRLDSELQALNGILQGLSLLTSERHDLRDSHLAESMRTNTEILVLIGGLVLTSFLGVIFSLAYLLRRADRRVAGAKSGQARIENALNTFAHGFAYFDADDRLLLYNDCYRYLLRIPIREGLTFEETLRMGIQEGVFADVGPDQETWIAEQLRLHRNPTGPLEVRLKDGRWILVDERRTGDGGRAGLRIDITRYKELLEESGRKANEKASYLSALGSVTQLPLELLGDTLAQLKSETPLATRGGAAIGSARTTCSLLSGLIEDSVMLSDPGVRQLALDIAEFDTAQLWRVPVSLLQAKAESRGVTLARRLEPSVPERLRGDLRRLTQVTLLLLDEAVTSCLCGEISMRLTVALPDVRSTAGLLLHAEIGCCALEGRSTLEQTSFSARPRLLVAERMLSAMGGRFELVSGKLIFEAPIRRALRPLPSPAQGFYAVGGDAAHQSFTGDLRMLVVEDERINRRLILAYLERMGIDAEAVGDGTTALARANESHFDLILMDISLPGLDGVRATQAIRSGNGICRDVPILALTANAKTEDIERCLAAGMNGHLAKPVDPARLAQAFRRWLKGAGDPEPGDRPQLEAVDEGPLDKSALDDLVAGAGGALASELIGDFLADLDGNLETLQHAAKEMDEKKLIKICHTIKGSAALFGASELSEIAAKIEEDATHLTRGEAFRLVSELSAARDRSRVAYADWQSLHAAGLHEIDREIGKDPEDSR